LRSLLDIFDRRPSNLAAAPAYVRAATSVGGALSGIFRSGREAHMSAMGTSGTLFQIVDRTAFTVSTAEWVLWRSAASGRNEDRVAVTKHAALSVLNRPNAFMTRQELFEVLGQHFELTGEAWTVVVRTGKLPIELWPVRPDRMEPVPSASTYLAGYRYLAPDGEKVPLELDEVLFMRRPNPLDMYRGIGAVGAVLLDIDGARSARAWNNAFFTNSAEPGGVIEAPDRLSDDDWKEYRDRWAESHRGLNNAHRVAILEAGAKWVPNTTKHREMEFVKNIELGDEQVRKAFGFPKPLLGSVDDVNRANADAANYVFSRWLVQTRLDRIKGMLNNDFLPMFGATAVGLEFDYVSPVEENTELDNASRDSKINAARTLVIDLKATRESVIEALELPATLQFDPMPEPQPALAALPADNGIPANYVIMSSLDRDFAERVITTVRNEPLRVPTIEPARRALNQAETAAQIDLSQLQAEWERELNSLLIAWQDVTASQRAQLQRQIQDAVERGDAAALAELTADHELGAELLAAAMIAIAAIGAAAVQAEAAAQGVAVELAEQDEDELSEAASAMALMLAVGLAGAAGAEALRRMMPGADAHTVATEVDQHLAGLSEAHLRERLGGTLTKAQNLGRLAQMEAGPQARYYASEVLDKNTCGPCREIDGKELPNIAAAMLAYGGSGYLRCEGTWRCRGTVVAVYE
jgi:HK97 family phage portal protein